MANVAMLKPKQVEALTAAVAGDCMCVLPTGFGKTMIMKILPDMLKTCIIIINPLNCIMDQQETLFASDCLRINDGILSGKGTEFEIAVEKLKNGKVKYIIAHPEQAGESEFKKLVMNSDKCIRISHIVVDEAHCVLSWGTSNFRPAYTKIGMLRAILPHAHILALTATATKTSQQDIIKILNMVDTIVIKESPDRPNVILEVRRRPSSNSSEYTKHPVYSVADEFLTELKNRGVTFPKTIIYVPLKWCGLIHERSSSKFGVGDMVAQYHAPQSQEMKSYIVNTFSKKDSPIRILLATEAWGMGIDVSDVRTVVHISSPSNIETFIQEIGRCGRDGKQSNSVLYYNNSDISSSKIYMQEEMKSYIQTDKCRREYLLNYFGFEKTDTPALCCDNCNNCTFQSVDEVKPHIPVLEFSYNEKKIVRQLLLSYFTEEHKAVGQMLPHLRTGLSEHLIEKLLAKPVSANFEQFQNDFPALHAKYLLNIHKLLSSVQDLVN